MRFETRQQFIKNTGEDLLNSNTGFTQGGIQQKVREIGLICNQPTVSRIIKNSISKEKGSQKFQKAETVHQLWNQGGNMSYQA